jgi:hypothetical protein
MRGDCHYLKREREGERERTKENSILKQRVTWLCAAAAAALALFVLEQLLCGAARATSGILSPA